MARIADTELERLKREVSLVRLIEGQGIRLLSQGKDLACRCPWHEGDETPSCIVTPKSNLWHCFGCDAGGTVIDWVMRSHRVSFRHACELLLKEHPALVAGAADAQAGVAPKLSQGKLRQAQSFALETDADQIASDQRLLDQVIEFYHETLLASPEALKYLEGRGLGNRELIERFRFGFANRTLAYRLAPKQYKAGAQMRAALQRIGILRESGHEHFNGSIVVPLWCPADGSPADGNLVDSAPSDSSRHVVGAYARKINDNLRAGTPMHLYLPGPHRGVLNGEGLQGQREVILCEAILDALTFWAAGYRNVTSCLGVNGLTDELVAALKTCGAERVLIAFDRDDAGDRGAEAVAKRLMAERLECYRLLFPKGMDANEYASRVMPAEKSLGVVIRSAQWMGRGVKPLKVSPPMPSAAASESPPPAVESSPLGAEPNTPDALADDRISTAPESAAKKDASPAQGISPQPMLPEPEAAAVPAGPVSEPKDDAGCTADEQQLIIAFGERRYRVRGMPKQLTEALKVNVLVTCSGAEELTPAAAAETGLHVDTLDLYQAKARAAFAKLAALEISVEESVIQHDLGRLLLKLEQVIDERARAAEQPSVAPLPAMSADETAAALAFLRDEKLIERIVGDFERVGLVGEPSNALVAYLACISRKLASPLAVLIQSTSAAGKSTFMDAVLALTPEEDRVHYSAMTGQSLFYLGEQEIKHKILAIAEEEGVRQAAYALKVLQSQGELTIASTGKDPATGMLVTQQYRVEGPVMLFLTTTAIDVDEELTNRCLVLTINESREQTRAIQARQRSRRTLAGLMAQSEAEAIQRLHRNAQRLLRPLAVVNPYAERLTFLDDRTRTRRDHAKYLTLIETIALLHQHQRDVKAVMRGGRTIEYIEATLADIALANELAHEVLGRSLDELPPQTRRVLGVIESMVEEECRTRSLARTDARFTRRELRARCGMSDTAVRIHLERLVAMEYARPVAGRSGQRFEYELLFDGDLERSAPQMIGLIDVSALGRVRTLGSTIATSQGQTPDLAPCSQAARTPVAPASQSVVLAEKSKDQSHLPDPLGVGSERARPGQVSLDGHSRSGDLASAPLSSSLAAVFSGR
ncbi:MAG TPA: CHC2 zinc finger domain-containing protein [Steroidobacteraceae bacterium]|nr:CHC2 zinc finger domain-containing protein [Steroidobacteraceae bacterium]